MTKLMIIDLHKECCNLIRFATRYLLRGLQLVQWMTSQRTVVNEIDFKHTPFISFKGRND